MLQPGSGEGRAWHHHLFAGSACPIHELVRGSGQVRGGRALARQEVNPCHHSMCVALRFTELILIHEPPGNQPLASNSVSATLLAVHPWESCLSSLSLSLLTHKLCDDNVDLEGL